jgi:Kef-type K+ transport system membrane component KefB
MIPCFILALFVISVYLGGQLCGKLQCPALIAEIGLGMLWVASGFFPADHIAPLQTVGNAGLMLMVFDGGVNMDIPVLKQKIGRSTAVALSGGWVAMLMCFAIFPMMGYGVMEGLTVGSALASTGIGFSLVVMKDLDLLQTPMGQLVCAAAMIDDVHSMILLAILNAGAQVVNAGGPLDMWSISQPLAASAILFVFAIGLRMALGKAMDMWRKQNNKSEGEVPFTTAQYVLASVFLAWLMANLANEIGTTYLLGCFLSGVVASQWQPVQAKWTKMSTTSIQWLTRIFFSCTVGMAVPLEAMIAKDWGVVVVITLVAVVCKMQAGLMSSSPFQKGYAVQSLQVGCAMVGRGELGFMQMLKAYELGLVSMNSYIGTIWALLLASCFGPLLFRVSMRVFGRPDELPTTCAADEIAQKVESKAGDEPLPNLMQRNVAIEAIKQANANTVSDNSMEAL